MRTPTTAISAGQMLRMPEDCVRYELAKGALVEMALHLKSMLNQKSVVHRGLKETKPSPSSRGLGR